MAEDDITEDDAGEDRLYRDPALALFYDLDNGWGPDLAYCLELAQGARSVLDLGCGTGLLAARLAERRKAGREATRDVVGVDPAAAMLDIARRRAGAARVTWVCSQAQALRLERSSDLVLLTGHAFQVFLSDDDQRAVLAAIARHLAPEGRFIFDTRNSAAEEWREWTPARSRRRFAHPTLGPVAAWNDASQDPASGIVTYETHYLVVGSGRRYGAASRIRFTDRDALAARLAEAGLVAEDWLGDWQGGPWTPESPEIIPIGRRR